MTVKNVDLPAMPFEAVTGRVNGNTTAWINHTGLTKRETFCLHMGVAETGDADLDAIIRKGNQQKMAIHIASGILNGSEFHESGSELASKAVRTADALLAELERTKTGTKQQHLEVLAGWQLVPVEATREMIDAAILVDEDGYAAMHSAMLAAAPKLEIKQ